MSDLVSRVKLAVKNGVIARTKYFTAIELPDEQMLGLPADPDIVARVEASLGRALPPSYREFLLLFDGWKMVDGGVDLVKARDLVEGDTFQRIEKWRAGAIAGGDELVARCVVIGTSEITATKYLLDPDSENESGEWALVQHHQGEEATLPSFIDWLEESVDEYLELAQNPLD